MSPHHSPLHCTIHALVVAAGRGQRFSANTSKTFPTPPLLPKQYQTIRGAPMAAYSLYCLAQVREIHSINVVISPDDDLGENLLTPHYPKHEGAPPLRFFPCGGAQRADSVRQGLHALSALADDEDWVLVHDCARPLVRADDIRRLIHHVAAPAAGDCLGGILAIPVADTLKRAHAHHPTSAPTIAHTENRAHLWAAQTPQMFRLRALHTALTWVQDQAIETTDEAMAMELYSAGHPNPTHNTVQPANTVQLILGARDNIKITYAEDLRFAEAHLTHLPSAQ